MQLGELKQNTNLNINRLGRQCYTSFLYYHLDKDFQKLNKPVQETLCQITTNLEYVFFRFDKMDINHTVELIQKSFVQSFDSGFYEKSRNKGYIRSKLKDDPRAKAKLLSIINHLWLYRLEN